MSVEHERGRERKTDPPEVPDGRTLCGVEGDDGMTLTGCDPSAARVMELFEKGARKYQNALRELAE